MNEQFESKTAPMLDDIATADIRTENSPKKRKLGFHPKKWLKDFQQKLYTSQYLYLLFCFLVPVVCMYIMYLAKGLYPFFDGSPLVLDLNAQYVYFFEAIRSFVYGDASLLYSFARSLGGEFMGIYAYYTASPFTYIVALFPAERIQEAVLTILLLKAGLSGLTMGFYLHKRSKNPQKIHIFTFSMMYALCAYAVVQQNNTMWIDALLLLPLFVYGLEKLITERKFKLYVLTLSAILIFNYYIGYMVCIFAVLYFFYYYFSKSKEEINPYKEKLHFWRTGARFAAFSILSAAISAFMLIAAYYSLGFGKSEFSSPNWSLRAMFDIGDFLVKLLPGAFDTVEPSGLPFIYCGVLALFTIPIYFTAKNISTREKVAGIAIIAVFILSFFTNPIDLIWHGFSRPNWLNARYSFIFCFLLVTFAYRGFGNLRGAGEKFLLALAALMILFVAAAQKFELVSFINSQKKLLTFGCVWFSVCFIIALFVILCVRIRTVNKVKTNRAVSAVLAGVVCVELLCNGIVCFLQFHKDVSFASYSVYINNMSALRPVMSQLEEYDNGFYRSEKTTHRTKNDNMAIGMKGLTSSTSTLNADAIEFADLMGYVGRAHLTIYDGGTPFSDSFMGIKYVFDTKSSKNFANTYTLLENIESEKYNIYQNPYAFSLAFGVDSAMADLQISGEDSDLNAGHYFERYNTMITTMLGSEEEIEIFKSVSGMKTDYSSCECTDSFTSFVFKTEEKKEGNATFTFTAPYTGSYYFYSPIDNATDKIYAEVNGKNYKSYLGKDTNCIFNAGYHEEGEVIEISLELPENEEIKLYKSTPFLWYLDNAIYEEAMTKMLSGPQFDIDGDSTDDHLFGSITTAKDEQMILTTIPYDEGWKVYVDGEEVDIYESLNALMCFDIASGGEHTLELKYMPDCYKLGVVISIMGVITFIVLCGAEFAVKHTRLKNIKLLCPPAPPHDYWTLEDFDNISEAPLEATEIIESIENTEAVEAYADESESSTDEAQTSSVEATEQNQDKE